MGVQPVGSRNIFLMSLSDVEVTDEENRLQKPAS